METSDERVGFGLQKILQNYHFLRVARWTTWTLTNERLANSCWGDQNSPFWSQFGVGGLYGIGMCAIASFGTTVVSIRTFVLPQAPLDTSCQGILIFVV